MTVMVCGATGTTGSRVVRGLVEAGRPVRAVTRSAEAARRLGEDGVEVVVADLVDVFALAAAMDGVEAVYVATNASPALPDLEGGLARAAAAAGVPHLVKLSVIGADVSSQLAFGRLHAEAERAVAESGVVTTFVRPNGFMQNTLAWADQLAAGVVHLPVPDARWSIVDVRDVARVAVAALLDPERLGRRCVTVTGPEASSPREQVGLLGELLSRPVEVVEVSIDDAVAGMVAGGWPTWSAERMGELLAFYDEGGAAAVSDGVDQVLGRRPRDYEAFAADHRDAFMR